jgi:predicted secreted hydrolase
MSNLAEDEILRYDEWRVRRLVMILDLLQGVYTVCATDIDLECSQRNPWVLVAEENGKNIKDGIL